MEQLAKKYGYANYQRIYEYIKIYENREAILEQLKNQHYTVHSISYNKALRVLKQLKTEIKEEKLHLPVPQNFAYQ